MSRPAELQKLITTPDGKAAKLRASCDACNESKVRCSQSKPVCARCEKHDILCIYGLSRRTHRTAPRIGALAATRHRAGSEISSSSLQPEGHHQGTRATNSDMNLLPDFDNMHSFESSNDYTISPALQLSMDLMQNMPTPPTDYFSDRPSLSSPSFDDSANLFALMNSHLAGEGTSGEGDGCNCSTRVIRKLLSIPLTLHDGKASFDVQLSELKHAIKCCEDCIQCDCASRDEMTIMTLSILVGRIVEGFETSLPKSDSSASQSRAILDSSSSKPDDNNTNSPAPRLSWGVLEIENEDEDDLKQHLWLLHFRKLEGLLKQLGTFIQRIRNTTQANGDNSAHVMACGFILMWLEQKAQVVRNILVHPKAQQQLGHGNK